MHTVDWILEFFQNLNGPVCTHFVLLLTGHNSCMKQSSGQLIISDLHLKRCQRLESNQARATSKEE